MLRSPGSLSLARLCCRSYFRCAPLSLSSLFPRACGGEAAVASQLLGLRSPWVRGQPSWFSSRLIHRSTESLGSDVATLEREAFVGRRRNRFRFGQKMEPD